MSKSKRPRVLIIVYYWPPAGGGGVQRNLKFVKYFREFGWEPVVYTPDSPDYPSYDESLLQDIPEDVEVVKTPIWEPYDLYRKLTGKKKGEKIYSGFISKKKKPGLGQRMAVWIRGNWFIPDARKFWIKPSVKFLKKYLAEHPVDAMISSGPPHSMHLIARGVKKHHDIPWVADFRDPWTMIDFYQQLKLTKWADNKHKRLERAVLKEADQVVTVTWNWAELMEKLGAPSAKVITNGFDPADFEFEKPPLDEKFSLTHVGSLNRDRNPQVLWDAIAEVCRENADFNRDFQLRLIGPTDQAAFESIEKAGIKDKLEFIDHLPHKEVIRHEAKSQVLLLLINHTPNMMGIVPGKLYEYLGAGRPVLSIGEPKADSSKILRETGGGVVCDFADKEGIKQALLDYYADYQKGSLGVDSQGIMRFSRKALTGQMAELLNSLRKD